MNTRIAASVILLSAATAACDTPAAPDPVPPAFAAAQAARLDASGTFQQTAVHSLDVRMAGRNTVLHQESEGTISGTISGTFEDRLHVVLHPNGTFTTKFTISCVCTVDGRSGTIELTASDRGEVVGATEATFAGRAVITAASGDLEGLHGVLRISGAVDIPTGLSTYQYDGTVHFR